MLFSSPFPSLHIFFFLSFLPFCHCTNQRKERTSACDMLVAVDSTLFSQYDNNEVSVKNLVQKLVDGTNEIYHRTIFTGEHSDLYFRLLNVEILFDFCNHCNQTQMEFLSQFSKFNYHDFCLAILFTYRDFPDGLAGLAWKGTVCSETFNTGFITFLNNNANSTIADAVITLAHEVGHLFGATHDEDTADCKVQRDDFIMSSVGTSHPVPIFSPCSLRAMRATLREKKLTGCFKSTMQAVPVGLCGNGVVEGLEQCDCGMDYRLCDDPCCYAGRIAPRDRYWNETARPCQINIKQTCTDRFYPVLVYGIYLPFTFIIVVFLLLCLLLTRDWRGCTIARQRKGETLHQNTKETSSKRASFFNFLGRGEQTRGEIESTKILRLEVNPIIRPSSLPHTRLVLEPKRPGVRMSGSSTSPTRQVLQLSSRSGQPRDSTHKDECTSETTSFLNTRIDISSSHIKTKPLVSRTDAKSSPGLQETTPPRGRFSPKSTLAVANTKTTGSPIHPPSTLGAYNPLPQRPAPKPLTSPNPDLTETNHNGGARGPVSTPPAGNSAQKSPFPKKSGAASKVPSSNLKSSRFMWPPLEPSVLERPQPRDSEPRKSKSIPWKRPGASETGRGGSGETATREGGPGAPERPAYDPIPRRSAPPPPRKY